MYVGRNKKIYTKIPKNNRTKGKKNKSEQN